MIFLPDDWDNKLVPVLVPEIFRRGTVNISDVDGCTQGVMYAKKYILQVPSGEEWLHDYFYTFIF